MRALTSSATPIAQAAVGFVDALINLGQVFHVFTMTADQLGSVNLVVVSGLALVSGFRAGAQRAGRLVRLDPPPS